MIDSSDNAHIVTTTREVESADEHNPTASREQGHITGVDRRQLLALLRSEALGILARVRRAIVDQNLGV